MTPKKTILFIQKQASVENKKKDEDKYINNNDSNKNYNYGTTQLYYTPADKMEESFVTRQRVYIGSKN